MDGLYQFLIVIGVVLLIIAAHRRRQARRVADSTRYHPARTPVPPVRPITQTVRVLDPRHPAKGEPTNWGTE